jgi:hypothetical protein
MACALAAMNIILPLGYMRFSCLPNCIQFVLDNPPDKRFRQILALVSPLWISNSLFHDLYEVTDPTTVHATVFQRIREQLGLVFTTYAERPTILREFVSALAADSTGYGYTFLSNVKLVPPPEHTDLEQLGASIVLPGIDPDSPLDITLTRFRFRHITLSHILETCRLCILNIQTLHIHAFVSRDRSLDTQFACMPGLPRNANIKIPELIPFSVAGPHADLMATLSTLPHGSLILKIDERLGQEAALELSSTGHPVFVLLHDTRPSNILSHMRRVSGDGLVSIAYLRFKENDAYVMIAHLEQLKYYIMSPITRLGINLIELAMSKHGNWHVLGGAEIRSDTRFVDLDVMSEVGLLCYGYLDSEVASTLT